MLIPLSNTDKKAIIDAKNWDLVKKYTWRYKKSGPVSYYVAASSRQNGVSTTIYLHRLIMRPGNNTDVHHIDENTLNNREENLEKQPSTVHRRWHLARRRGILQGGYA